MKNNYSRWTNIGGARHAQPALPLLSRRIILRSRHANRQQLVAMARRGALVAGLLALLLGAAPASPALARDDLNSGAPPAEEALAEVPAAELAARRQALRDYFATRRQRLKVVATTVTDSGQVLDWIP